MSNQAYTEFLANLADGSLDDYLDEIDWQTRQRRRRARQEEANRAALEVAVGDRVILGPIKPKAFDGVSGTIVEITSPGNFVVDVASWAVDRHWWRYGKIANDGRDLRMRVKTGLFRKA